MWPMLTDQKLNEIVGSAYYVAPEVLRRSYGTEADIWSIGVIAYILLCGSRPFWARTESGIFRAVLKASPGFNDDPWPSSSSESKDFVRCLLCKDPGRRISAAQALCGSSSNFIDAATSLYSSQVLTDYLVCRSSVAPRSREGKAPARRSCV